METSFSYSPAGLADLAKEASAVVGIQEPNEHRYRNKMPSKEAIRKKLWRNNLSAQKRSAIRKREREQKRVRFQHLTEKEREEHRKRDRLRKAKEREAESQEQKRRRLERERKRKAVLRAKKRGEQLPVKPIKPANESQNTFNGIADDSVASRTMPKSKLQRRGKKEWTQLGLRDMVKAGHVDVQECRLDGEVSGSSVCPFCLFSGDSCREIEVPLDPLQPFLFASPMEPDVENSALCAFLQSKVSGLDIVFAKDNGFESLGIC